MAATAWIGGGPDPLEPAIHERVTLRFLHNVVHALNITVTRATPTYAVLMIGATQNTSSPLCGGAHPPERYPHVGATPRCAPSARLPVFR